MKRAVSSVNHGHVLCFFPFLNFFLCCFLRHLALSFVKSLSVTGAVSGVVVGVVSGVVVGVMVLDGPAVVNAFLCSSFVTLSIWTLKITNFAQSVSGSEQSVFPNKVRTLE